MQLRRADEGRFDPRRRHPRQIADELDRVAEAMIVEHEDAVLSLPGPGPGRIARPQRLAERLAGEPARFVAFKAALEVAERQEQAAFAGDRFAAAERLGRLERRQRLAVAAEIAQRQRLAAQRGGIVGPRGAGAAVGLERLLHPVELQKRVAEVDRRASAKSGLSASARRAATSDSSSRPSSRNAPARPFQASASAGSARTPPRRRQAPRHGGRARRAACPRCYG